MTSITYAGSLISLIHFQIKFENHHNADSSRVTYVEQECDTRIHQIVFCTSQHESN